MGAAGASDPGRDRRLAAAARHGPRRAAALKDVLESWLRSPAARRARRYGKVVEALDAVLPESQRQLVVPVAHRRDALTLEVANAALLAELRQFRQQELVAALVARGTGITRLVFRLRRMRRQR